MTAVVAILTFLFFPILFGLSLLDFALRSVQYHKIMFIARQGNRHAEKLLDLLISPERAISVLLFLRYTLSAVIFFQAGILLYRAALVNVSFLAFVPLLILAAVILLEYIPRMLALQNPERIAFTLLKPFELVLALNRMFPLPQGCERFASAVLRLFGLNAEKIFSQYSVNEIKMFVSLRREKSDSELKRHTIDQKFLEFSGRRVREVMVPRPLVKAIDIDSRLSDVVRVIKDHGCSRIPVFHRSFDNIIGILHAKDVIGASEPFSLRDHLRKPFFVPEAATVQTAFQHMRRNRSPFAIVVDEYGGADGIVTLEDLIEELIGEIHDEYDAEVEMLQKVSDATWLLEGNLPIKELNQNLNLALPENSSYTTVAGFLLSVLDKIPSEKEQIHYGNLLFSVEKMMGHKISKIFLTLS